MMWPNPSRALAMGIALNQLAAALTMLPLAAAGCGGAIIERLATDVGARVGGLHY